MDTGDDLVDFVMLIQYFYLVSMRFFAVPAEIL